MNDVINTLKNQTGTQTSTVEEALKVAEDHFTNLFKIPENERSRKRKPLEKGKEGKPIPQEQAKKLIEVFTVYEVKKAIKNLKNGKAAGPDGIPNEFLKAGGRPMRLELMELFNKILKSKVTPESWREGKVILIYKGKGDRTDMNNYRGITLNNNISKLFSKMLCERLYTLSEKAGWLGQIQNGFRKSRQSLESIFRPY